MWYSQFNFQIADGLQGVIDINLFSWLIWYIYVYQERTMIYIYSDELCDRKIYVPRLLLLCVPGNKRQVQRCFTWWFICNKNLCVTFVNLLENQQTPLYWTLYILHMYRRPNQYAVKEFMIYWKVQYRKNSYGFNAGCNSSIREQGVELN